MNMVTHADMSDDFVPTRSVARKSATAAPSVQNVAFFADFRPLKDFQPSQAMEMMMTKNKEQIEKMSNEAAAFGKESMDAWMKSGNVFMKGYEDMMKTCMSLAQKSAEKNGEAFKTLLACKTVSEYAEVQNRLAQQGFDDFMTGATKISELGIKLASEGFAPINDQVTKTMKKAGDAVAA